jgi:hypothetical protein
VKLKLKEGGREDEKGLKGGREKKMGERKKYYDIGEKISLSKNAFCICVWLSHSLWVFVCALMCVCICVCMREKVRVKRSK